MCATFRLLNELATCTHVRQKYQSTVAILIINCLRNYQSPPPPFGAEILNIYS